MKDQKNSVPQNEAETSGNGDGTTPAERALAEAAERRAKAKSEAVKQQKEIDGPKGLEPTRYGDWEKGGITSDF